MAASEAVLQVCSGTSPSLYNPGYCLKKSNSVLSFKLNLNPRKNRGTKFTELHYCHRLSVYAYNSINGDSHGCKTVNGRAGYMRCHCRRAESINKVTTDDGNEPSVPVNDVSNASHTQDIEFDRWCKHEKAGFTSTNGSVLDTVNKTSVNPVEEEAWNLLRESMVYYCGNPIGTIAANDPSSSSILNYDQVFIRDFIPSGIAFLLKGEYDIVRSFILHTLQLQVPPHLSLSYASKPLRFSCLNHLVE